jgi:hypothetical protein
VGIGLSVGIHPVSSQSLTGNDPTAQHADEDYESPKHNGVAEDQHLHNHGVEISLAPVKPHVTPTTFLVHLVFSQFAQESRIQQVRDFGRI